jgi:hypothetical protein
MQYRYFIPTLADWKGVRQWKAPERMRGARLGCSTGNGTCPCRGFGASFGRCCSTRTRACSGTFPTVPQNLEVLMNIEANLDQ